MDQPGPGGHVIGTSLIIDNWTKRPAWLRRGEWVVSALMWLLYFYLIREALIDLYDLAIDAYEWAFTGAERPYLPAISRFLETLRIYGLVILLNAGIFIGWALYNNIRFQGPDRRRSSPLVSVADLALLYVRPEEEISQWQNARILVMHHSADGTLTEVTSATPQELSLAREAGATIGAD